MNGKMSAISTKRTIKPDPSLSAFEQQWTSRDLGLQGLSAYDPKRTSGKSRHRVDSRNRL
jgi:hypothetical protein